MRGTRRAADQRQRLATALAQPLELEREAALADRLIHDRHAHLRGSRRHVGLHVLERGGKRLEPRIGRELQRGQHVRPASRRGAALEAQGHRRRAAAVCSPVGVAGITIGTPGRRALPAPARDRRHQPARGAWPGEEVKGTSGRHRRQRGGRRGRAVRHRGRRRRQARRRGGGGRKRAELQVQTRTLGRDLALARGILRPIRAAVLDGQRRAVRLLHPSQHLLLIPSCPGIRMLP